MLRTLVHRPACLVLLSLLVSATPAAAQFVDVSGISGTGTTATTQGVAWGDYDGDGDLDLAIARSGGNTLYRNEGGGIFVDVSIAAGVSAGGDLAVAWADYDNDGDLDLATTGSVSKLFRNEGGGVFADVTTGGLGLSGNSVAWADFNGDGDLDLYKGRGGPNQLFRNDAGSFVDVTGVLGVGGGETTYGVAWGDYDGDNDLDLYVSNFTAANRLYRNDGGAFVDVTAVSGPIGDTSDTAGSTWGDYDNDGDLDLYVANYGTPNKLFRNDGGVFANVTAVSGPVGDAGNGLAGEWGDYDNDGDLDLYLSRGVAANRLYRNEGGGVFADVTVGAEGDASDSRGTSWGDYDGDGDLDLYIGNVSGTSKLLRNDIVNGNHWLHVDLTGLLSNRNGIGARVRVVAGGVTRTVEVSGGGGWLSQPSLTAEFGLGASTTANLVEVRWPSGLVTQLTNVSADQVLDIVEPVPFVDVSGLSGTGDTGFTQGVAWGDYDGDGDLDLAIARSGGNRLYRNEGGGSFAEVGVAAGVGGGGSLGVTWGDYDNDGDLDLATTGSVSKLFRNEGGGVFADVTTGGLGLSGNSVASADFNGDGDLDL